MFTDGFFLEMLYKPVAKIAASLLVRYYTTLWNMDAQNCY